MRRANLIVSLLGVILFGGAFALSYIDGLLIERAARELVRIELERRVGEKIDVLSGSKLARLGERALQKTDADIDQARQAVRDQLPRLVAGVVADMLNADCECRKRLAEYATASQVQRLAALTELRGRLVPLIESTYADVAQRLLREFRIFTASNAVAFALLGLVMLVRQGAALQLFLPALVLVGSVIVAGGLYLFNQDWLHTIVFGEYVGWTYAAYLAGVALLLSDVAFNRARVTSRLVNGVLQALGSAATAVPC